jgi:hypothetical protein
MDKKMWIAVAVAGVLVVAAFFGGAASARLIPGMSGPQGLGGRQFGQSGFGGPGAAGGSAARMAGGGAVSGKVLKSSAGSITVQGRDGSSRIVNLSAATKFSKTVDASAADASVGTTVTAFGQPSSGNTVDALQVVIGGTGFGFGGMRPGGGQGGQGGQSGQGGQGDGPPAGFPPPGQ